MLKIMYSKSPATLPHHKFKCLLLGKYLSNLKNKKYKIKCKNKFLKEISQNGLPEIYPAHVKKIN